MNENGKYKLYYSNLLFVYQFFIIHIYDVYFITKIFVQTKKTNTKPRENAF